MVHPPLSFSRSKINTLIEYQHEGQTLHLISPRIAQRLKEAIVDITAELVHQEDLPSPEKTRNKLVQALAPFIYGVVNWEYIKPNLAGLFKPSRVLADCDLLVNGLIIYNQSLCVGLYHKSDPTNMRCAQEMVIDSATTLVLKQKEVERILATGVESPGLLFDDDWYKDSRWRIEHPGQGEIDMSQVLLLEAQRLLRLLNMYILDSPISGSEDEPEAETGSDDDEQPKPKHNSLAYWLRRIFGLNEREIRTA